MFKSRTIASIFCKKGHVKINEKNVKPSKEILIFDNISIRKNQVWFKINVIDIPKSRISAKIVSLYCINKTDISLLDNNKLQKLSPNNTRDKRKGRPTKKDRREIDEIKSN